MNEFELRRKEGLAPSLAVHNIALFSAIFLFRFMKQGLDRRSTNQKPFVPLRTFCYLLPFNLEKKPKSMKINICYSLYDKYTHLYDQVNRQKICSNLES